MIAHLTGKIKSKATDSVIVDVQGVGYQLHVSLHTFYELPIEEGEVSLYVHTHVREDQITLFGFLTAQEKMVFGQLLKVTGIGPKSAMTVLSGLSPNEIIAAIALQDSARFKNVPGIGQKTAERILLDLKGKMTPDAASLKSPHTNGDSTYQEALSALLNLGYPRPQAESALTKVAWAPGLALTSAIKEALKQLVK